MDARSLLIAIAAHTAMAVLGVILAVGYLASRIIEGTMMMAGIIATLLLIPLSPEFLKAGASQSSWFQTIGDVLKQAKFLGLSAVSLPMLGLGGLLFTWMLFGFRLVPRVISVVGLIGYALVFLYSIVGWFGLIDLTPGAPGPVFWSRSFSVSFVRRSALCTRRRPREGPPGAGAFTA